MRYVVVENGLVTNIVEWDGKSDWQPPRGIALLHETAGIGDAYDGREFTPAEAVTPEKDELAQLKAMLVAKGVLTDVEAASVETAAVESYEAASAKI